MIFLNYTLKYPEIHTFHPLVTSSVFSCCYNLFTMSKNTNKINVEILPAYIAEQSEPHNDHYVFSYTVTIRNEGDKPARLLKRHWIITDGDGQVQEVKGEGVIGKQTHLAPGEDFQSTSGPSLDTQVGIMRGSYEMLHDARAPLEADIPHFTLAVPNNLHQITQFN